MRINRKKIKRRENCRDFFCDVSRIREQQRRGEGHRGPTRSRAKPQRRDDIRCGHDDGRDAIILTTTIMAEPIPPSMIILAAGEIGSLRAVPSCSVSIIMRPLSNFLGSSAISMLMNCGQSLARGPSCHDGRASWSWRSSHVMCGREMAAIVDASVRLSMGRIEVWWRWSVVSESLPIR